MTKRKTIGTKEAPQVPTRRTRKPAADTASVALDPANEDIADLWDKLTDGTAVEAPATDRGRQTPPAGTEDADGGGATSEAEDTSTARTSTLHQAEVHAHGAEPKLTSTEADGTQRTAEGPPGNIAGGVEEIRRVADLKPNSINAKVFRQSLSEPGLAELMADLTGRGLRYPIEITADDVILDGERRWRAAMALGWTQIRVVVRQSIETPEDVERYILRAFATTRDATVEERVGIYRLAREVLARDHGRPAHRPPKGTRAENRFWSKEEVWAQAAKCAGFSSHQIADKAATVFRKGGKGLREAVNSGEMSISAAYDSLSEHRTKKANPPTATGAANKPDAPVEENQATREGDTGDAPTNTERPADPGPVAEEPTEPLAEGADPSEPDASAIDETSQTPIAETVAADGGQAARVEDAVEQGTDGADAAPDVKAAWSVVMTAPADSAAIRARIADLASKGDLDVWIPTGDDEDDIRDLGARIRVRLGGLVAENCDRGVVALDALVRDLRGVLAPPAPTEEEPE